MPPFSNADQGHTIAIPICACPWGYAVHHLPSTAQLKDIQGWGKRLHLKRCGSGIPCEPEWYTRM